MKKMYKWFFSIYFFLVSVAALAQTPVEEDERVQMAEGLRSSGKIYVVVAVLLLILAGLFFYLVQLDRKLKRLEKDSR